MYLLVKRMLDILASISLIGVLLIPLLIIFAKQLIRVWRLVMRILLLR